MNQGDTFHVVYTLGDVLELISALGDPISYKKVATFLETGVLPHAAMPHAALPSSSASVQKAMDTSA